MIKPLFLIGAICCLCFNTSYADILKDFTGTWNVTFVTQFDGEKETTKSQDKIKRLKNGTLHHVSYEKIKGKFRKTSEAWYYPSGELYAAYFDDKGNFEGQAEGTWKVKNSSLHFEVIGEILEGEFDYLGSLRRVNKNKWVGFFTAADAVRLSVTMIRAKK